MFYTKLEGNPLKAYADMCDKLKGQAMKELGLGPDQVILRELKPDDLDFAGPDGWSLIVTGTSAGAAGWSGSNMVGTVGNGKWIGIHGVQTRDPAGWITQLRIQREGSDARFWDVEAIRGYQNQTGYADDPVTIDQQTSYTIYAYGRTASTLQQTKLLGAVAEKRGITINP